MSDPSCKSNPFFLRRRDPISKDFNVLFSEDKSVFLVLPLQIPHKLFSDQNVSKFQFYYSSSFNRDTPGISQPGEYNNPDLGLLGKYFNGIAVFGAPSEEYPEGEVIETLGCVSQDYFDSEKWMESLGIEEIGQLPSDLACKLRLK